MNESSTLAVIVALGALIPSAFSWLTSRAVRGIDESIKSLGHKVEEHAKENQKVMVELAEHRIRLISLELQVSEIRRSKP